MKININIGLPNLGILRNQFRKDLATLATFEKRPTREIGYALARVALEVLGGIGGGIAMTKGPLYSFVGVALWVLAHDVSHLLINGQKDDKSYFKSTTTKVIDKAVNTNLYGVSMAKNTVLRFVWEPVSRWAGQQELASALEDAKK